MHLGLIPFYSGLHDRQAIEAAHAELLAGLRLRFQVSFIEPNQADTVDQAVAFIASGGTEDEFRAAYPRLPQPLLLLADGRHNSLAAALEILAWIRERGDASEILHGDLPGMSARLDRLSRIIRTRKHLSTSVIGMLGAPSPWLIASHVDPIAASRRWGVTFKALDTLEFTRYRQSVRREEAVEVAQTFMKRARAIVEPKEETIISSAALYLALKHYAQAEKLDAISVRCFDFLSENLSGCLALGLLNEEGLVAGCEGDAQTAFSMLLIRQLTGAIPFMANPSLIDRDSNRIILSHCTIAPCLTSEFVIRSHFESGKGVAIQGEMPPGPVTLFKCGRPTLDRFFISGGRLLDNLNDTHRCRTQVELVLEEPVDYFLQAPLANHHVLIPGNHVALLREFTAADRRTS